MLIAHNTSDIDLLARIMRAEALSDGDLGMLMVGNVVANRVLADCLTFKNVNSIYNVIYQPNQFSGTRNSLFNAKPTTFERSLAERILKGEYYHPATNALWFYAPSGNSNCQNTWYDQDLSGRYKSHCFYNPDSGICKKIH
ncbi:MAG: cell wall hydrolase [Firmicutes bacterium]|nr:cell wall hydrolase [Bacillota bacterium]